MSLHIDGKEYAAEPERHMLEVCLSHGFDLPFFCWHPALGSVGACRQCAVKQFRDEKDTRGKIVMACMTPATDGTRVSIDDAEAQAFRSSVIEWLMENHPHDCPVCDEGGECHLQDMTVMTGHVRRRYRFKKRTYRNQDLGPFLNHEMNRCITCYRCVRFYQDYAGGHDLAALGVHNHVYFGRHEDGPLENEFSGNLAEVCPTGVFTDKTLKVHYTRKWDLRSAPSVCVHCGVGCNTLPAERYSSLRRITNRYNGSVNGYFLCDRGRYGYGFVNGERRLRQPFLHGRAQPLSKADAVEQLAALAERAGRGRVVGIGSPRASLEANFALRALVGPEAFYAGVAERDLGLTRLALKILQEGFAHAASVRDIEGSDAALVLGEDVSATAPRLALALRQSVRQKQFALADAVKIPRWHDNAVRDLAQGEHGPLFLATPAATRLDDVATAVHRAAPDDIARLGWSVAHALDATAPHATNLAPETEAAARAIADALRQAERPLVVSGPTCGSAAVLEAAAGIAAALAAARGRATGVHIAAPECNSLGLVLLEPAGGLEPALDAIIEGRADTLIVVENDLYRRAPARRVSQALDAAAHVVVLDHITHETTARGELLLPAGAFPEADGTFVSSEGRAQRFFQVYPTDEDIQESWRWLRDAMAATGRREGSWTSLDDVVAACAAAVPALAEIVGAAPSARFRIAGQRIPRMPSRSSGRAAISADVSVHEPPPPTDLDTPLSFSMEGTPLRPPGALVPFFWAPRWNSNQQASFRYQREIGGPLLGGDPGQRLLEPQGKPGPWRASMPVPDAFRPRDDAWLVVPIAEVFGSEELSALSPPVASRAPAPYLALNPRDAARLGLAAGGVCALSVDGAPRRLRVALRADLPPGVAGVPMGIVDLEGRPLPDWGRIEKVAEP
jgi:NADH-quinone oxidoreductase subunit G